MRCLVAIALLGWAGCGLEDIELTGDSGAAADAVPCGECELPETCRPAPDGTACSLGACLGGVCTAALGCESGERFVAVAAGERHTCALGFAGTLYCWGENPEGQLGVGDFESRLEPEAVGTDLDWEIIGAGWKHSCGQRRDETDWCWGKNNEGQLGVLDTANREAPAAVQGDRVWSALDGGENHTCGIESGSLWCWGLNADGQLGLGTLDRMLEPTQVEQPVLSWREHAVGGRHTCAVDWDGGLWCWGLNDHGQLGIGTQENASTPQAVAIESVWARVSAGGRNSCAIDTAGVMFCWGRNADGEAGAEEIPAELDPARLALPVLVAGNVGWSRVSLGDRHACGVSQAGALWCWGLNADGQLGLGDSDNRAQPALVSNASDWSQLSVGKRHSCALRSNGALFCWGENDFGQLGLGDIEGRSVPTQVCAEGVIE